MQPFADRQSKLPLQPLAKSFVFSITKGYLLGNSPAQTKPPYYAEKAEDRHPQGEKSPHRLPFVIRI